MPGAAERFAYLSGDLGPVVPLAAQIRQSSFLLAQAFADLLEQFPPRGQLTRPGTRGSDRRQLFLAVRGGAAAVPALPVMFTRLERQLPPRHADQQLQQVLAHADWLYDFQKDLPPSFVASSNPPSAMFSSSVGDGVM